jgi:ribosomal protein S18 acetylase RimI-like enzyme
MTALRPMPAGTYPTYLEAAILGYAHENVTAGRWPEPGSMERSRDDFLSLLPAGLATPDNHLFELLDKEDGAVVGFVWYAMQRKRGACTAFIYDLEILEAHRRQGHGTRALAAVEQHAAKLGATAMALNVFTGNRAAQDLYSRSGFVVTNMNMLKRL